jgi:hypothetical protein
VVTAIIGFLCLAFLQRALLDYVAGTTDDRDESRFRTYTIRTMGSVVPAERSPRKTTTAVEFAMTDGRQMVTGIV